jgi:hypothetical protein
MSAEDWGDVAMLGLLALLWGSLFVLAVRRTYRWDWVTRAITIALLAQAMRESVGLVDTVQDGVVPPPARWALRVVVIAAALTALVAALRDRPPGSELR